LALTIHGAKPESVFRLYGADENSGSFALGWTLEQSPCYLRRVVAAIFGKPLAIDDAVIALQKYNEAGGYTDVEIRFANVYHAILEAKRGWDLPGIEQLQRYHPRLIDGSAKLKRLVSVSMADKAYAARHLPASLDGVQVVHLAWADLKRLAEQALKEASRFEEKLWLRQLMQHFQEFITMDRQTDNNVFVVSLTRRPLVEGRPRIYVDVVEQDCCYFHLVGKHWPVEPPNYVGFRYDGKLQSVHHVESFTVVENLAKYNRLWPVTELDHFVYRLGPPMLPAREVKPGKVFRNARVWCAIDTLLSGAFATVSDARDETKRRLAE